MEARVQLSLLVQEWEIDLLAIVTREPTVCVLEVVVVVEAVGSQVLEA